MVIIEKFSRRRNSITKDDPTAGKSVCVRCVRGMCAVGTGLSVDGPVVGVVRLVVHDELFVHEVETVRPRLVRVLDHELRHLLVQSRELVDMLAGVLAVWDTETKVEVESLQVGVAKEMPLDHTKVLK